MKKIVIVALMIVSLAISAWASDRNTAPLVIYLSPESESVVDLTGKDSLAFSWKPMPLPLGGRLAYKFSLYKDFGYDVIVSKKLSEKRYSIKIPAEKFENGATYTWQVKQRSRSTRVWGIDHRWSFKVKK